MQTLEMANKKVWIANEACDIADQRLDDAKHHQADCEAALEAAYDEQASVEKQIMAHGDAADRLKILARHVTDYNFDMNQALVAAARSLD